MLVTLEDGAVTSLFDTEKMRTMPTRVTLFGGKHGLRLHVFDPDTGDASKKFVTYDKELQDKIMSAIRVQSGHISHQNTWIKPKLSRQEFWDDSGYRRMVKKDLERYFTDVVIRGNSLRYIYYVSDGKMESTPDAIGTMFRKPLVYEGLAIATVFDLMWKNPLSPGNNIVHWLTKPMWDGFHSRKRKVPKDFPGPTGFVASHWCQREGYGTYNNSEIRIASMTQGQSVGRWAVTSMRQYWMERQGKDLYPDLGKTFKVKPAIYSNGAPSAILKAMSFAIAGETPYGKVGLYCVRCAELLGAPYGKCNSCGNSNSTYDLVDFKLCKVCGKAETIICECGDPYCGYSQYGCNCAVPEFLKLTQTQHKTQYRSLVSGNFGGDPPVVGHPITLTEV